VDREHPAETGVSCARATPLVCAALAACAGTLPGPTLVQEGPKFYSMPERVLCAPERYDEPSADGEIEDPELVEASGLVASARNPGVLWAHNDSGDGARLFALTTAGASLGQLALSGVEAVDIEDIAAAPCPDLMGPCLYLADTGNNLLDRSRVVIYAVPEPEVSPQQPLLEGSAAAQVWTFPVLYPGDPANVEALVVTPNASMMVLYEKVEPGPARIFAYRAPWTPDADIPLEEVGVFDPPGVDVTGGHLITGADLHTSGKSVALRTYTGVWEVRLDLEAGDTPDRIDDSQLVEAFLGPLDEPQGEAVAYDEEGSGIWTLSESPDLTPGMALHRALCIR
jgi:hypothetical protein